MSWHMIGLFGAALTTFSFIQQVMKIWKNKSARDVSFFTLFQLLVGTFLWTIYGFYLNNLIIIAANIITFTTVLTALILYFRFKKDGQ